MTQINLEKEYIKLNKPLLNFVRKMTKNQEIAEEIVQDSFIKMSKVLETNMLENDAMFKTYLYAIAKNEALTALNKVKNRLRIVKTESYAYLTELDNLVNIEENLIQKNNYEKLKDYINMLPETQKITLNHILDERSNTEIAEIMSCPYNTAKANYRHGLLKLTKAFNNKG